jgi:excisionase family DNA binding protein
MTLEETIESLFRRVAETTLRDVLREDIRQIVRQELQQLLAVANQPSHTDEYVSAKRAAELLGVSEQSVRRWIGSGELSVHRAGRLLRLRLQDVRDYLARSKQSDGLDIDARARAILAGANRRAR